MYTYKKCMFYIHKSDIASHGWMYLHFNTIKLPSKNRFDQFILCCRSVFFFIGKRFLTQIFADRLLGNSLRNKSYNRVVEAWLEEEFEPMCSCNKCLRQSHRNYEIWSGPSWIVPNWYKRTRFCNSHIYLSLETRCPQIGG